MATTAPQYSVTQVMDECRRAVRRGLGKKRLTRAAKDYWETNHERVIAAYLAKGANWDQDRKTVLKVAYKMGRVAAVLTDGSLVLLWAAESAHVAVKRDPACPPPGRGGYCDF